MGNRKRFRAETTIKMAILRVGQRLAERGWCMGSSGNISALMQNTGHIYIKATGRSMGSLRSSDLLLVDMDGKVIKGSGRPSEEIGLHRGIYRVRADVGGVIHTHSPFATAYAVAGLKIPMLTAPASYLLKEVPLIPFAPPGSKKLAAWVAKAFSHNHVRAALLERHGVVATGRDIDEAYDAAEWVEDAAKVAALASWIKGGRGSHPLR